MNYGPGLMIASLLLAGCGTVDLVETNYEFDPVLYVRAIDQSSDRFSEIDPLRLNEEIIQWVEGRVGSDPRSDRYLAITLQDMLFGEQGLNLRYSDRKTYTAIEVFETREGNCLSVMNLYVALARHLGLDASFQTIREMPVWDRRSELLVLSQHINATGRLDGRDYYVADFTPQIALQRNTDAVISDEEARALYFNNLGVEALFAGNSDTALAYLRNALFIDPDSSEAWNNLGAAYNQMEDAEMAEFSYHYALETDPANLNAVNNLARMYRERGELELAGHFERAATAFNLKNPYFQFGQGLDAYREGDYAAARDYFRRAIKLNRHEPEFHLGLSRAFAHLGEEGRSRESMELAEIAAANDNNAERIRADKLRIFDRRFQQMDRSSVVRESSLARSYRTGNSSLLLR